MLERVQPSGSRRVLVDTSAYYALSDVSESRHQAAEATRGRLVAERWRLFTTNFIVAETHALLLVRLGYDFAIRFLDQLSESPTVAVRVSATDERRASAILHEYDDKRFSFTDASTFAVMERLRIGYAFTFDRNFLQYGLSVLSPNS